jgi:hypothetical protein
VKRDVYTAAGALAAGAKSRENPPMGWKQLAGRLLLRRPTPAGGSRFPATAKDYGALALPPDQANRTKRSAAECSHLNVRWLKGRNQPEEWISISVVLHAPDP